jgi:transglutaminase-like putative cysteine protease
MRTALALSCCCLAAVAAAADLGPEALGDRTVAFTYEVAVHPPQGAKVVDLWAPIPQAADQQVLAFTLTGTSEPVVEAVGAWGDRVGHVRVEGPADVVTMVERGRVRRTERRTPASLANVPALDERVRRAALAPTPSIVVNDEVRTIAAHETAGKATQRAKARALYDWVWGHMRYDKSVPGAGLGDVPYCLRVGKGNCTDFHSLFIALARTAGVPVRWNMGFPLAYGPPAPGVSTPVQGYHCWAEFWDPGAGWVPVDISEARKHPGLRDYFFGSLSGNRILFTRGRDLVLPGAAGGPRNYLIYPVAEVDGVPYKEVTWSFTYQDE